MEKIFDIAKDSEQSWGTLATAIDGELNSISAKCGDVILKDGYTENEADCARNFLFIRYYGYDFSNASIAVIYNTDAIPRRIIIKDSNGDDIVGLNFDNSYFCQKTQGDKYICIGYDWSNHTKNVNVSVGNISVSESAKCSDDIYKHLSNLESKLKDIGSQISSLNSFNNNLYKFEDDDKLTVLSENKGVYIDGSLTIRTISNEIFMVDVYEVVGGDTYSFRSSGFMLLNSYPAIIFSTTPFGVNVKADELILSASTTPEDVDIVYTVKNDGYIFIAHVSIKPNIDVYSTTKELVTDIHSRELHDLSQLSAIKGKNVAVLGDSIMMLMRTYNIGANTITYKGEDDIDYSYDNLTNVNGYLYVTSSLDEGSVVEGSIKCEIVNSQQSNYNSQDWKDLQEKLKASSVINFGLGGATIAEKDIITPYPYPDQGDLTNCLSNEVRWLVRRYESAEIPSPDCFIIWLGTNGAGQPSTDNYDEIMDLDWATLSDDALGRQYRKTFYGGLRYSIEMLYRKFKNSTICVLTPIQTNPENYRTYEKLSVTASAIIKMSQRYSCIHIDALNEIGIVDLFEKSDGTGYWLSDGLHPNSNGKKLISNYLSQRIHSLYFSKN